MSPQIDPEHRQDFDDLTITQITRLPIWTRRWILQEVALAQEVVLQAGSVPFEWHDLVVLMKMVDKDRYHPTDDFYIALAGTVTEDPEVFRNTIRRGIRPMQLLRSSWHMGRKDGPRFDLLDLVQMLRSCDCGRPSDRVFALLGLINDHDLEENNPVTIQETNSLSVKVLRTNKNTALVQDIHDKYRSIVKDEHRDPVEEYCTIIEAYARLVEGFAKTYGFLAGLNSKQRRFVQCLTLHTVLDAQLPCTKAHVSTHRGRSQQPWAVARRRETDLLGDREGNRARHTST